MLGGASTNPHAIVVLTVRINSIQRLPALYLSGHTCLEAPLA
jgi:hypothetical protein